MIHRLKTHLGVSQPDPAWLSEFSVLKYRPMERLLCESDYSFLAEQAGYCPSIAKNLRSQRRKIFLGYLSHMVRDFNRLHAAARISALYSTEDQTTFINTLMKQRLTFLYAVGTIRLRVEMHRFAGSPVDIRGLVAAIDAMRLQVGHFAFVEQPELAMY